MRIRKLHFFLLCALLLVLSSVSASFASKADELFAKGAKYEAAAKASKRSADKAENYDKAVKAYDEIATSKKYKDGTPEAALALYKGALIKAHAPGVTQDWAVAHETIKKLLNLYDKPAADFELEKNEIDRIQKIVADAQKLRVELETKLDHKNSTTGYSAYLYKMIDALVKLTGSRPNFSYWFAIVLLTAIIKIIITPLTKAQFKAMKEMQVISPKIKEIQEKHKGDQKTIGEKTMDLYKEHKINPFASCLPLLIQMPIIMVLWYTMKAYEFQFQKGTFLWIGSGLSHLQSIPVPGIMMPGSTVWFTAKSLAEPDIILVLLYMVSMYISTKMSAVDPTQADQQKMMAIVMPLMLSFIFAGFPSAFLLYWLTLNVLQTVQQYFIMRAPLPAAAVTTPEPPSEGSGGQRSRRRRR